MKREFADVLPSGSISQIDNKCPFMRPYYEPWFCIFEFCKLTTFEISYKKYSSVFTMFY
jgi:hypothetical protein